MPCVAELNESESERLRRENEKTKLLKSILLFLASAAFFRIRVATRD